MHRTKRVPRAPYAGLLLISLMLAGARAGAQAPEVAPAPRPAGTAGARQIIVSVNQTVPVQMTTATPPPAIMRVFVERDNVARVSQTNDPTTVRIQGLAPGTTPVTFTDTDGREEVLEVIVQFDVSYLQNLLQRAVPTANISIIPGSNNTVILSGNVAHSEDIQTILNIAGSVVGNPQGVINALRVGGVMQVQLDVVVARVTRSELRRMSFDFMNFGLQHVAASTVGGAFNIPSAGISGQFPGAPTITNQVGQPNGAPANIFLGIFSPTQDFFGLLQWLKDEAVAKLLAEPRLVTLSGRPASFVSGGQQAVPTVSGFGGTAGVEFVPFGTQLNFLPIVLGDGKIYLEVEPQISALDDAAGVVIPGGGLVPGRVLQSVRTSVIMEPGQTFIVGGLVQNTTTANISRVPVLGDIPFLNTAFSRKNSEVVEEELVVLVTPHLVDPMDCQQVPKRLPGMETRTPDDFELFLEGIVEAPRGPRAHSHGRHYVAAYKNDPTFGQYPCGGSAHGAMPCGTGCCPSSTGPSASGEGHAAGTAVASPAMMPSTGTVAPVTPPAQVLPPASGTVQQTAVGLDSQPMAPASYGPATGGPGMYQNPGDLQLAPPNPNRPWGGR